MFRECTLCGKTYRWDNANKNYMITEEGGKIQYFKEGVGEITEEEYRRDVPQNGS